MKLISHLCAAAAAMALASLGFAGLAAAQGNSANTTSSAAGSAGTLVIGFGTVPRHLNSAVQSGIATGIPADETPRRVWISAAQNQWC